MSDIFSGPCEHGQDYPANCLDDIPEISTDELVRWLENKYRRHGEIEDGVAARRLQVLVSKLDRLTKALGLATELMSVPEHAQDDEWYEKQRQVIDALEALSDE